MIYRAYTWSVPNSNFHSRGFNCGVCPNILLQNPEKLCKKMFIFMKLLLDQVKKHTVKVKVGRIVLD